VTDQTDQPLALPAIPAEAGTIAGLLDGETKKALWGLAGMLAESQFVPDTFRGKQADCFVACHLAARMGEDPITLLQNTSVVKGKPGLSARYRMALAEKRGVFRGPIRFKYDGAGPDLVVTAVATLAETGEEVTAEASMAMAKAEGWTRNPKYGTLPKQMLSYRAGTFLCRLYDPAGELGFSTREELEDVRWAAGHGPRGGGKPVSGAVADLNAAIRGEGRVVADQGGDQEIEEREV
jgi:hypothetical protein